MGRGGGDKARECALWGRSELAWCLRVRTYLEPRAIGRGGSGGGDEVGMMAGKCYA